MKTSTMNNQVTKSIDDLCKIVNDTVDLYDSVIAQNGINGEVTHDDAMRVATDSLAYKFNGDIMSYNYGWCLKSFLACINSPVEGN